MYTIKACLYLTLIASLLVLSVLYRCGKLTALTIPLVLMAGLSSLVARTQAKVRVERAVESNEIFAGEEVAVKLKVVNEGRPLLMELKDCVNEEVPVVHGSNRVLLYLINAEDVEYVIRPPSRGLYVIGPVIIELSDPMGLWKREYVVCGEARVAAFPRFSSVSGAPLGAKYTGVWPGEVLSRRSGRGTEFYGVREYVPGDELRRVNWKASARLRRLMSNEFVEERVTDVLIVVDAGWSGVIEDELAEEVLEHEVSAAAALALALLRAGNRVGLLTRGEGGTWVKPGFGRRQLLRVLYRLAELRMGEQLPLSYVLRTLAHYLLKPHAQVVLISPVLDRDIVSAIREISTEYEVLVISPNPFSNPKGGQLLTAYRLLELEREMLLTALSRTCKVVDWDLRAPLTPLLKRVRVRRWAK